jgi:S-DNA-T family DNA segregation ATPase FtsK/SpoIIIE
MPSKKKNNKDSKFSNKFLSFCFLILALFFIFSFFGKAGLAGKIFFSYFLKSLFGESAIFLSPIFILAFCLFFSFDEKFQRTFFFGVLIFILSFSSLLASLSKNPRLSGGWIGYLISLPFLKLFDSFSLFFFSFLTFVGLLIFLSPFFKFFKFERIKESLPKIEKRVFKFFSPTFKVERLEVKKEEFLPKKIEEEKIKKIPFFEYKIPPFELLDEEKGVPLAGDIEANSFIIKRTLENFGIKVEMSGVNIGPTVTQYTLKPADGVKLSKITSLSNDLALALAAHPIRIEAPIPGKSLVGIEVPNKQRMKVRLRSLISNKEFLQSPSNLTFVLGRDVSGKPVYADLARMPHLLVAGATGTGKTIFLNSLILSLLYRNSPRALNFILVDPKRVEFPVYNDLPHLKTEVIFDGQKVVNILKWLIVEMERRFDVLASKNCRDINSLNLLLRKEKEELLPYIVLIIDELADLMAAKGKEMEAGIVRLAQLSRAVGIHLVLATQRPSVEVITGLIKANITSRISFQVASQVDSRTILDMAGAEKLLGMGDMLFLSADHPKPKRIQGAFVSEKEVKRVVDYLKENVEPIERISEKELISQIEEMEFTFPTEEETSFEDPLLEEAKKVVIEAQKASASLLQRKLRIGYARAARILDILEKKGIVGPAEGAKPRKVYIPKES